MGRYTTFSKQDVLKDLGSTIPEVKDGDMGIPQADFTASFTMTGVRDPWLSPAGSPLADDTTVPSIKPDTKTQKDLPTVWTTSPSESENQITPTIGSVDKLAVPPSPSCCLVKE